MTIWSIFSAEHGHTLMLSTYRLGETLRRHSTDGSEGGYAYPQERQDSSATEQSMPEPSLAIQDTEHERHQDASNRRGSQLSTTGCIMMM